MAKLFVFTIVLLLISGIIAEDDEKLSHDQDFSDGEEKVVAYTSPILSGFAYLAEHFDDQDSFSRNWIKSEAKKEGIDEEIAKYDGTWAIEEPIRSVQNGDLGLVLKSTARHAAISSLLNKPFVFNDKPLIVQYEVYLQEGQECGGAYLKLLTEDSNGKIDLKKFHDKTPYTIMFGPDKCGNDHKLHFIFRHKNPLNGTIEEKHCKKPKDRLEDFFKDKLPHLYTLIVRPDNTFTIKIDNKIINEGSLLDDFQPPVNPPLEIEDPNDKQPEDWDDREKIPDPSKVKPDDWDEDAPAQIVDENDKMPDDWLEDEPINIPNPDSVKPDDWDIEIDGEWEPPEIANPKCENAPGCGPYKQKLIDNPRFKGKWRAPLINNVNYKGKWKPRLIHNPDYFNDVNPFKMMPIRAIGFELWSISGNILFDNLIITDDEATAKKWADDTFEIRRNKIARESWSVWNQLVNFTSENPWIWAVYIIVAFIPVLLIVYCCCFSTQDSMEDTYPTKEFDNGNDVDPLDDESPGDVLPETPEQSPRENEAAPESENDVDSDNINETDQVVESEEKDENLGDTDGPRRRKPNKE
ncbi:hypothetical protein HCN44_008769 [Aphidius gifuensis]|uniref:Calnexin n=1 Tax=Aphidius gifuensis TaxID=684658 RepID=A0A835CPP2_APHGI|nr:calnexin [Aphidius gifuensis]KAF7991457.1 hypothetical protein HCN44_008769 [Aphidius gifuensis]